MNRRNLMFGMVGAAGLALPTISAPVQSEPREISVAEARLVLAEALKNDEEMRQCYIGSMACLIHDSAAVESIEMRELREAFNLPPHRIINTAEMDDCNYLAELLIRQIFFS